MFKSFRNRGFHLTFSNGWTISVQFGPFNYCEHYDKNCPNPMQQETWSSEDAEIAIWHSSDLSIGEVKGWCSVDDVASLITFLSSDPAPYYFGA